MLLVTLVMAVGLIGSGALVVAVEKQQADQASEVMDQRVQVIESAVTAEVRRYVETVTDLAAAVGAQSDLTASDFVALTATLDKTRLPGVSGVGLVVPGTDRQIPRIQRVWRERGNPQLTLVPAEAGGEHLFVVMSQSLDGTQSQTGRDIDAAVAPTQAMRVSRSRAQVTTSATYVLLKDRTLPSSQQQQSFIFAAPIFAGVGTAHEGRFEGWLLMGMRGRDFIDETMNTAAQSTVSATLSDESTSGAVVPVASVNNGSVISGPALQRRVAVQVAGRTWRLQVQPTTRFMATLGPSLSVPAGGAGVAFTLLIAVLVGTLSTSRNRALAKVERATTALRADIERRELVEATLRAREDELHLMALTDALTGLANRRAFMDQLEQAHARAVRDNSPVCVLFCDVDHFKAINDTYGHAAGDQVLREVAGRLRQHFRTEDVVGRLGGDEFAVICENGSASTELLLGRLREVLSAPYDVHGQLISASVSVGMASPQYGETSAQLLERADSAMYLLKASNHVP